VWKEGLLLVGDDRECPVVEAELHRTVGGPPLDCDRVASGGDAGLVPDDRVALLRARGLGGVIPAVEGEIAADLRIQLVPVDGDPDDAAPARVEDCGFGAEGRD
jgi:hypothetical protein